MTSSTEAPLAEEGKRVEAIDVSKATRRPWTYEFVPDVTEENALPKSEWTGVYIGPIDEETGRIEHTIFEGGVTHGLDDGDPKTDIALLIAAVNAYGQPTDLERELTAALRETAWNAGYCRLCHGLNRHLPGCVLAKATKRGL